ncbi:MAG: M48 family metallopeptidase [Acidobacteria bacterium]|nr:M48 family metallopeptidase [Acidobacteriota bacterium]
MSETIKLDGLVFEVRRSLRRKTLGLTVNRTSELVLHAPDDVPTDELERWTRGKLLWVHRKLLLKDEATPKVHSPEYVNGESFSYLGRWYRLSLVNEQSEPLRFDGTRFILRRDAVAAESHFRAWYISTGSKWLKNRVTILSRRVNYEPSRIEVRDLGYRWGSCGKNGVLFFNWKLLQLPVRVIDYVILHELVHLIEAHHQPAFWQALERALPDWQARKIELENKVKDFIVFGLAL